MSNVNSSAAGDTIGTINRMAGRDHDAIKRVIDCTIALTAILVLFPIFVIVAMTILGCSGRPVIFRHKRIGAGGRVFDCFKFRTMHKNGDAILQGHLVGSEAARTEWAATRKLKVDPRVTVVGRFLRKSSIDEIPQLINVVVGHMSLVGPRPIVKEEALHYGEKIHLYCSTKPGITGPWQIGGRSDTSYETRVRIDCEYINNRNNLGDLLILAKTLPIVLSTRGSY